MTRYYELGLPRSNYHGPYSDVAFGENNHISRVFIDSSNEYGVRVIFNCYSEHDWDPEKRGEPIDPRHWYSIRDHKGDVFVALIEQPTLSEVDTWVQVWPVFAP